jgi:hypothetical protein
MRTRPSFFAQIKRGPCRKRIFERTMSRAEEVGSAVFATAHRIGGRFFLLGRNLNGRERTDAIEHGELACVTATRF